MSTKAASKVIWYFLILLWIIVSRLISFWWTHIRSASVDTLYSTINAPQVLGNSMQLFQSAYSVAGMATHFTEADI